ncbi:hypothetical protein EC9_12310 [Rosistilla ulvae]|uniref:Uncharacterized protein n=1 Tax=Rosistilla ulvae TaxID=1930277 RepID=A0A517LWQ1_9BACT|nr:hypothetical protein [Rosistilla ulvae]QDS87055.1 hypothetical protein EC9_12310 [Rosistilla ulvae]
MDSLICQLVRRVLRATALAGITVCLMAIDSVGQEPEAELAWDDQPVVRFRKSMFQGVILSGGYVSDAGENALSIADYKVSARLAVPLGSFQNLLVLTPSFRQYFVNAGDAIDVPDRLYETGVSLFTRYQWKPGLSILAMVSPQLRTDFETEDSSWRLSGFGVIAWEWIPEVLTVSFGAAYLGRDDLPVLPAVGLDWRPNADWRLELMFPRPRLMRRIAKNGPLSETWAYASIAPGGNTFNVRRSDGRDDELTLGDIRTMLGVEQIRDGGRGWFAELGLAFARTIEYESGDEYDFDAGMFGNAGVTF